MSAVSSTAGSGSRRDDEEDMIESSNTVPQQFERGGVLVVVLVGLFPLLLLAAEDSHGAAREPEDVVTEAAWRAMRGPFVHTILEWSAIMCILFSFGVALLHFWIRRNIIVLTFFGMVLASGAMDVIHTLVANQLALSKAADASFVPFTWAMSRMVNSASKFVFVVLIIMRGRTVVLVPPKARKAAVCKVVSGVVLVAAALSGLNVLLAGASLPQTQYPGSVITRPFDMVPLVLFAAALAILAHARAHLTDGASVLVDGVALSTTFDVLAQLYMAFGSSALFDFSFHVSHFFKALSFLVPSAVLVVDMSIIYALQRASVRTRAEALMDEFVTTTTHDLGTPLMAFSAGCELMADMDMSGEASDLLSMMRGAVTMMKMTRNNVLNYSRILEGKDLVLDETQVLRWDELVADTMSLVLAHGQMVHAAVDLKATLSECLVQPWRGEASWMQQILVNLLSNAAKFTDEGYVHVRVRTGVPGYEQHVLVEVLDTGPGVPDAAKQAVFTRFWQASQPKADPDGEPHSRGEPGGGADFAAFGARNRAYSPASAADRERPESESARDRTKRGGDGGPPGSVPAAGVVVRVSDRNDDSSSSFARARVRSPQGETTPTAAFATPGVLRRKMGGTGVGLFSVARQVSALGGLVGVRDNREDGATHGSIFWFAVPLWRFRVVVARGGPGERPCAPMGASASSTASLTASEVAASNATFDVAAPWVRGAPGSQLIHLDLAKTIHGVLRGSRTHLGSSDRSSNAGGGHALASPDRAASPAPTSGAKSATGSDVSHEAPAASSARAPRAPSVGGGAGARAGLVPRDRAPNPVAVAAAATDAEVKVLVVDDVAMNLKVATMLLRKLRVQNVQTAPNGLVALRLMKEQWFDLVLCDLQMPVCDGLECLRRYRSFEASRRPDKRMACVAMSALSGDEHERLCDEAGFDGVQSKPVTLAQLQALMMRHAVAP